MDLDLRLARHFVVLAETGHFGQAAERLHLTQSALTKQVRALERLVGADLIDRSRRPWRLTAVGEQVLMVSRDLCARADQALPSGRGAIAVRVSVEQPRAAPPWREQ